VRIVGFGGEQCDLEAGALTVDAEKAKEREDREAAAGADHSKQRDFGTRRAGGCVQPT
jgi:hypothetical protein